MDTSYSLLLGCDKNTFDYDMVQLVRRGLVVAEVFITFELR